MNKKLSAKLLCFVLCTILIISAPLSVAAQAAENIVVTEDEVVEPDDTTNVPEDEEQDAYANPFDVSTAAELENALAQGTEAIRIVADFTLDRTLYVVSDAIIYSEQSHTLTRASDFGGDIFVVGQYEDGTLCEAEITFQLGHEESSTPDLLTIDGNSANMTAEVNGTVIFALENTVVKLYHNLTVVNCVKTGNLRTLDESYGLSYPNRIGGAVLICAKSTVNIYGGTYSDNGVNTDITDNEEMDSTQGGAFYFFGPANIYGGHFENNSAYRGGAFYVYRTLTMSGGTVIGNYASDRGGAAYMAASTLAYMNIEGDTDSESAVLFQNNRSDLYGGALYCQGVSVTMNNATFDGNTSGNNGGAVYINIASEEASDVKMTATDITFKNNLTDYNGGAVYMTGTSVYYENVTFESNTALATANSSGKRYGGGAIYSTGSFVEINGAQFIGNRSEHYGGAVELHSESSLVMNQVTASGNYAASTGGFLFANNSSVKLYNSAVRANQSVGNGGAVFVTDSATFHAYITSFENNVAGGNGGALYVYTGAVQSLLHSCVFVGNTSDNYGGGIYVSNKSLLDAYNLTAKDNSAKNGGFMYQTTANTTVTLNGLIVEGNTATDGGPIIWGNTTTAILNINKTTYLDLDVTTELDDAYWATAIANKLTVTEITDPVPGFINYGDTEETPPESIVNPNITNVVELQNALTAGVKEITIVSDFAPDRTFYVTSDITINFSGNRTLTRRPYFGGDLFVIGQNADGELCEEAVNVTIKPLDAESTLTIDGNSANMTTDVVGTVFFVCKNGHLELREGITVTNCNKVGNERTLDEIHGLSYTNEIGGAVAIIAGGTLDIYGGTYSNNSVNDESDGDATSSRGGVIYAFGNVNIYGGTFSNNHAHRGGAFYVYRTMQIYNAVIRNNSAYLGGAVYIPASTVAYLYLGSPSSVAHSDVKFLNNTATNAGGAIYSYGKLLQAENTEFIGNSATSHGGAIAVYASAADAEDVKLIVRDSEFQKNTSTSNGGAVYLKDTCAQMRNVDFISNYSSATSYGGGAIYSTGSFSKLESVRFTDNRADYNGGAMALYSSSEALLYNVTANGNTAASYGGFIYSNSTLNIYNSSIKNSTSGKNGGAIYLTNPAVTNIYATDFVSNHATNNGGALCVYTNGTNTLVQDCRFIGNTADNYGGGIHVSNLSILELYDITATQNSAGYGGFMYETTKGTVVTVNGLTVSGNTDTQGGPIIWGNTYNAILYINKANYTDLDISTDPDDAYWAAAIYNKLTVTDITDAIPEYDEYGDEEYSSLGDYVSVSNAEELEAALNAKKPVIRVVSDITIDRTLYVTADTTIFSATPYRLTRAKNFAGDLFVVGEYADGSSALVSGDPPHLILGNPASATSDLLIIDGNRKNMEVEVIGSVIFACNSAQVDIYNNISIVNAHKAGNQRALLEKYTLSSTNRIGGAVVIVESGTLNIYGGHFRGNSVNAEPDSGVTDESAKASIYGGVIYNRGALNIYDGIFENNQASRGGVLVNYRMAHIYGGTFRDNHAYVYGGVVHMAGSEYSNLYIGSDAENQQVLFQNNTAQKRGGAVYSSVMGSTIIYGATTFEGNKSIDGPGGAIYASGVLLSDNVTYRDNKADTYGGAVYLVNTSSTLVTRKPAFSNNVFEGNRANRGGAIYATASSINFENGTIFSVTDSTFQNNQAVLGTGSTTSYGGAIYMTTKARSTISGSTFQNNTSFTEAGAIHMANESTLDITDSTFQNNSTTAESKGYGGAMAVHSSVVNGKNVQFTGNQAASRGGALYVSYTTASGRDSEVKLTDCSFTANYTPTYGGAIYTVDRNRNSTDPEAAIEQDRNLLLFNTSFTENIADNRSGAVYLNNYSNAYMEGVTFTGNQVTGAEVSGHNAGAIYAAGYSTLEINGGTFTDNYAGANAGGIGMYSNSSAVLNNITATGNTAGNSAGFMILDTAHATIFDSTFENNSCRLTGGAISTVDLSTLNVYNSTFEGNHAGNNGGALYIYQGAVQVTVHSSTFNNNISDNYGGVIYISNKSLLDLYNIIATENSALRGGFMYATTGSGKAYIDLIGVTMDGNTATDAGPIIYGNTTNAVLNVNKTLYTDLQATALDETYWEYALVNKLTVNEISDAITEAPVYQKSYVEEQTPPASAAKPILVDPVLELGENSSDAAIDSKYGALPKLDNSSNFMSKGTTVFENVNNSDVTVDTFVYQEGNPADNGNVGEGILIYQAIQYKKANPTENVKISISSFRFSTSAAVCVNRNSRYFGYMRPLYTSNYDKYGFVRISYLLVVAASMGIDVTVIGQLDGNPNSAATPPLSRYFSEQLNAPCDPSYADGVIGDYMKFSLCEWTSYDNKAGSDMMHTKMCAVSHYLDKDGVAHKNTVWSSSSNLDGIKTDGLNGVDKLQTATIISDHAELYRVATNYLSLVADYCGQEDVYIFRDIAITRSTQQIDLLLSGRGDEIPSDEQIVYLGTENDKVFELYFAPLGGDLSAWSEAYNPFVKYLRAMQNSDDSIILTWNNVKFASYSLRNQMQELIIDAFHKNSDPDNKIYVNLPTFDNTAFEDLTVGEDIGFMSFNKNDFGHIHSKDLQVSYSENGQRYYVSMLNSMNIHTGSMAYQSNFALVIKETNCDEGSVFFTIADETTVGIVEHEFTDEVLEYIPDTLEDGYTYHPCTNCDEKQILSIIHHESEWIVDRAATDEANGVAHKNCLACGALLETREFIFDGEDCYLDLTQSTGKTFSAKKSSEDTVVIASTPHTIEATVQLDKSFNERGGIIVGNYDNSSKNQLNLEVYSYGKLRLFFINNSTRVSYIFNTDVRSDEATHIALTVDGLDAKLYINGELKETAVLPCVLPELSGELRIGGDERLGNTYFFKGTIYSVNMFSDVRTADEVLRDVVAVFPDEEDLLTSRYITKDSTDNLFVSPVGKTFTTSSSDRTDTLSATPLTVEATVLIPKTQTGRAGVIVGNYSGIATPTLNVEVYDGGKVRLYLHDGSQSATYLFPTDIRSDSPVHIAVTIDGLLATLYVNGEATATQELSFALPETTEGFKIGGDNRSGNTQYFKGTIYSVNMFSCVRTAEQIKQDMLLVTGDTTDLLFSGYYALDSKDIGIVSNGTIFTSQSTFEIDALSSVPHTIEATVQLNKSVYDRGGVIVGNYDGVSAGRMNLEVYFNGKVRLFNWRNDGVKEDCIFDTDIRSDKPVHIAVTVDGLLATLYLDGKAVQTKTLSAELSAIPSEFKVGGDNRVDNYQYFKGQIYDIAMFSDVRTSDEIKADMTGVASAEEDLLYFGDFVNMVSERVPSYIATTGKTFNKQNRISIGNLSDTPLTFEAVVQVDKSISQRAGVIVGNYDGHVRDLVNLEIYTLGRVRLFYSNEKGAKIDCIFDTDIRSDEAVHIAVTVDGLTATLYVNGELTEQKTLAFEPPCPTTLFQLGSDRRWDNTCYFLGTIYSVNLFSEVRTSEQIQNDLLTIDVTDPTLLYNTLFVYDPCAQNGHVAGEWIEDIPVSDEGYSISHTECAVCSKQLNFHKLPKTATVGESVYYENIDGMHANAEDGGVNVTESFSSAPRTLEALIQLDKSYNLRAGVIMGNYDGSEADQLNLEVYTYGKLRLYYRVNKVAYSYNFKTDIRSSSLTHVALTIDGLEAKLYIDGALRETVTLSAELPSAVDNFVIGSDNREGNGQYFKGTVYSVGVFSDVRTAEEIAADRYLIASDSEDLLFFESFIKAR